MSDLNIQQQEDKYEEFYCDVLTDIIDECKLAMQDIQSHEDITDVVFGLLCI